MGREREMERRCRSGRWGKGSEKAGGEAKQRFAQRARQWRAGPKGFCCRKACGRRLAGGPDRLAVAVILRAPVFLEASGLVCHPVPLLYHHYTLPAIPAIVPLHGMIASVARLSTSSCPFPRAVARVGQLSLRRFASRRAAALKGEEPDEEELRAAREWLSKLNSQTIPRQICHVSFSRSSGPGGQNVNKFVS